MDFEKIKNVDARTRVTCALEKAKEVQTDIHAVVTFVDVEEQLHDLVNIPVDAPLYGMPVALKDNVSTKGIRTTASSRILDNYIPVYNAAIVDALKQAGAIIIAKTSMDELAMGGSNKNAYTGQVYNPWDTSRISGGSSGGSAALTASGAIPFAIGSDTGDSVRKPAAYNGIIGMKPTYGRISRYGIIPYASSLDHVGYFTTAVKDAATLLEVLAGRDDRDMTSSYEPVEAYAKNMQSDIKGKKIAILDSVQNTITNVAIQENFQHLIDCLQKRGAIIQHVQIDEKLMRAILPVYSIIANAEATANHSNLDGVRFGMREEGDTMEEVMMHSRTKGLCSYVRKRFIVGSYSLFEENQEKILRKAQKVRRLIVDALQTAMQDCDLIISSATGSIAPYVDDTKNSKQTDADVIAENHMALGNFSGYPSMTLPCGFVDAMPIAVNIMAKPFAEQVLFDVGSAIEEETGLRGNDVEVDE